MESLWEVSVLSAVVIVILSALVYLRFVGRSRAVAQENVVSKPTHIDNARAITVTAIYIYPIKSCKGISLQSSKTDAFGLEKDRRWMVISTESNRFVTQRQMPKMALITPSFEGEDLVVNYPDAPTLRIPTSASKRSNRSTLEVGIWSDQVKGVDEGDDVAEWFQTVLGRNDVRLVRMPEDHNRKIPQNWQQADMRGNFVSYADGFPFLLASEESLADLNSRLEAPILDLRRFRPNIIIKGLDSPYDEDTWKKIRIGDVVFRAVKKCTRCKLTTVNPDKGEFGGDDPLKTLRTYRKGLLEGAPTEVCFGQNLVHENNGQIGVGQTMEIFQASA